VYANYYAQIGNPYFDCDGNHWQRQFLPPDQTDFCPSDLVAIPRPTWEQLPDSYPLSADEARTLLWMFAGNVTRAAKYYRMPPARLRAFVRNVPVIAADSQEMTERLDALFSGGPKNRADAAARYVLSKSAQGRARGWSLTNKFVDAKADEKGVVLAWRD
jgi:hypothetical protein